MFIASRGGIVSWTVWVALCVIFVGVAVGCSSGGAEGGATPGGAFELEAERTATAVSSTVRFTARTDGVRDDGVRWSADAGDIVGSGGRVTWIAPDAPGQVRIVVTRAADDATAEADIDVVPRGDVTVTSFGLQNETLRVGEEARFAWTVDAVPGTDLACELDFDGDGDVDVELPACPASGIATFAYDAPGRYQSTILVRDAAGAGADTAEATVDVEQADIEIVSFTADPATTRLGNGSVEFDWTVDVAESVPGDVVCSLDPDGDGQNEPVVVPCAGSSGYEHTYDRAGSHDAELTVRLDNVRVTSTVVTVEVLGLDPRAFVAIDASPNHVVAVRRDGSGSAWGSGLQGELGYGGTLSQDRPYPVRVPDGVRFVHVEAGRGFSVALDEGGRVWSWGSGASGKLGTGTGQELEPVLVPFPNDVDLMSVSVGTYHTVALDEDGQAWAWGLGRDGRLGTGFEEDEAFPTPVRQGPMGVQFTSVRAGGNFSVALDGDGQAWAWGSNVSGQLGDASLDIAEVPVPVDMPSATTFTQLAAGRAHVLALDGEGQAWAWGLTNFGQAGTGTSGLDATHGAPTPVRMPPHGRFEAVAAGSTHSLAVDETGRGWSWGHAAFGQLGDGTDEDEIRDEPVLVVMPNDTAFETVAAGGSFSYALDRDGRAWSWGSGPLGDPDEDRRPEPAEIDGTVVVPVANR